MEIDEVIYELSPVWLQNQLVSLRGWHYRTSRTSDATIRAHLRFLRESEHWSPEQFEHYQIRQLQNTLALAFEHVPYFRNLRRQLGCQPMDFKSPEDIRRLPLLTKSRVRGHEEEFLNEHFTRRQLWPGFTSGTTGTPLNLFETQESFSRRLAFVCRLRSWAGLAEVLHPRRAQFTGRNVVPNRQSQDKHVYWRYNRADRSLLFSTTHISSRTASYYLAALRKFDADLIDGYPSALLVLSRLGRSLDLCMPRPKAIIVSAETLPPEDHSELEAGYLCRVYDQYGASEPSCFWCDCEHGVMHVNPEYGISEILTPSGQPALPGEEGRVVVTSFLNPAMPLIRYELGDVAVAGLAARCSCGRQMPRVERVLGRCDDVLWVPQRGYVGRLDPVFKGLGNIVEAQIVQCAADRIEVLLVPGQGYHEATGRQLVRNLRAKLGDEVGIEVRLVDHIPRGPNG